MRIGSLCSGYGGLELGVQAVYGGTTAWVSDIDKGACKILAHRFPGVPNIGDFTKTDWADVEPVDLICAGFPCQPVSHAGKRLGDDDERWLWDDVLRAVREVRPGVVVLENVRGLLTARDGELFGRVLGSLADLGYDAQWHGIKAADVGAPHNRFRVFITATDTRHGARHGELSLPEPWQGGPASVGPLLPSPRTSDTNGAGHHGDGGMDLRTAVTTLPTPTARDWKNVGDPAKTAARMAERGQPLGEVVVNALLPTPSGMNAANDPGSVESWLARRERMAELGINGNGIGTPLGIAVHLDWGQYAAAIARWESLTRPAPPPTETGPKGSPRLSAAFSEWLMGLPAGWVTDVPGITRNEALRALGNGVVPAQAEAALRVMASWSVAA